MLLLAALCTVLGSLAAQAIWKRRPEAPRTVPLIATPARALAVAADGDDLSSGVAQQDRTMPGFQFGSGGSTLSGRIVDLRSRLAVAGATVWITLEPVASAIAAAVLRTSTDTSGHYAFAHLAAGRYALAAAAPFRPSGGRRVYAQATARVALDGTASGHRDLALAALSAGPAALRVGARNLVVIELNGLYARTWTDRTLAPTIGRLAALGSVVDSAWADYGWPPIDDDVLATGSYPSWRTYDPWPRLVPWGSDDGIDHAVWYGADAAFWGQDSIFDVARRAGMRTAWLGDSRRRPTHLNLAAIDVVQTLGQQETWPEALQRVLGSVENTPKGFLFLLDLAPPAAPNGEEAPSPAAVGGRYAQSARLFDAAVHALLEGLGARGHGQDTALLLTAGEGEIGYSTLDNYYGLGDTGRGTSLQIPLILAGPGIPRGVHLRGPVPADRIAPTAMALLGLPAPAGARDAALQLRTP